MQHTWQLKPNAPADFIENNPEYNKIILQLLFNRGLMDQGRIEVFFEPDKNELSDPFLFKDMAAAVDLAIKHVKEQNLIVIYGDYDADGVTATALLFEILNIFKAKTQVYIPARTSEGYGLNKKAIDEILTEVNNGSHTKALQQYENLTSTYATEFEILLKKEYEEIEKFAGEKVRQAIQIVRERKVYVDPGYDGVFGVVKIFSKENEEGAKEKPKDSQPSLF